MHGLTILRQLSPPRLIPVIAALGLIVGSAPTSADEPESARREIVLDEQVVQGAPPAPGVTFVHSETEAARRAMAHLLQDGHAGRLGMAAVSRAAPRAAAPSPIWRLHALSPNASPKAVAVALAGFEKRSRRCRGLVTATPRAQTIALQTDAHGRVTFAQAPRNAAERCFHAAFSGHRFPYRRPLRMTLAYGAPTTERAGATSSGR